MNYLYNARKISMFLYTNIKLIKSFDLMVMQINKKKNKQKNYDKFGKQGWKTFHLG